MLYFKAVGGRGVDNVKPVHRSPSVSVFCQCVLFLTLADQMQRTTPKSGDSVRAAPNVGFIVYVLDIFNYVEISVFQCI